MIDVSQRKLTTTLVGESVATPVALAPTGLAGVLIGKAFMYGLGALDQAGVVKALELIRNELDVSMALTGTRDVSDIDSRVLWSDAPHT